MAAKKKKKTKATKTKATKKKATQKKAAKKKATQKAKSSKKPASKKKAKKKVKKKVKRTRRKKSKEQVRLDNVTVREIDKSADNVFKRIGQRQKPTLKFPVRALSNVRYDRRVGHFQLGRSRKERTLTVNTVKLFAQTLKMMSLSKEMVEDDNFATKREAYYISKNWGAAMFKEQTESDTVMDDIEALFSLEGVNREQLRFYPEEHGGAVAGSLIVIDQDGETGRDIRIDCTGFGSGAYTIPHSVEHLRFETKAKFVLAIETGGMFQRLNKHYFWRRENCILVETGGVPTRATRRFIRKLADERKLPVYAFVDCDPYGIANIYRTLKVGSGNAAHLNKFFCVPQARFLGVTPQDIIDFELQDATHPLKEVDVKRAKAALTNDPFFMAHPKWQEAIHMLLKMGVRAEQQALAKWGLDYVADEYLPTKLKNINRFLP